VAGLSVTPAPDEGKSSKSGTSRRSRKAEKRREEENLKQANDGKTSCAPGPPGTNRKDNGPGSGGGNGGMNMPAIA